MNYLLDTHIFLWSLLDPSRLSSKVKIVLEEKNSVLWLSPITFWEVMVLVDKGRLQLNVSPEKWLRGVLSRMPFREAALTVEVAINSRLLDLQNQDPADRFLLATAKIYKLTFITADKALGKAPKIDVLFN